MKKFIIFAIMVFVLCVPALADSSYFSEVPVRLYNSSSNRPDYTITSDDPVFVYGVVVSGNVRYFSISENSSYSYTISGVNDYGNSYNQINHTDQFTIGDYHNRVIVNISESNATSVPGIAVFPEGTTDASIAAEFSEYLISINPSPGLPTSFTVPRGNVLYFQVASNSDVTFESHFSENSGLFSSGNVYGPWGDTYQRISTEASLPGTGIEFPRSGSSAIVWEKGEPLNVLGQTKTGIYTDTFQSGTYYAFYNPAYQSIASSDGFGSASVGSNVTVSGNFSFIRIYSLQQIYDISTSTNDYDDYYVGTPDGDGGVTWVDQDDQISYPTSGGENQEDEPISSVSLIESIKRILRNILSEIESIFTFGFSAIRDLVDLMDEFVATFDDLYEWLPEECYTLLIACVSVAIAIGVFKVFL